jgi:hypothetical protein
MRTLQRWWPPVLAAGILMLALTGRFWAGEDKNDKMDNKDLDKKIGAVVKSIINRGADMHNVYRDTAGCYRFYEGSLRTLRPLLDDHADLQKAIDAALAAADRAGSMLMRGLILNRALHRIHNKLNPNAKKSGKDKKDKADMDKGPEDKAPRDDSKKDKAGKDKDTDAKDKSKDKDTDAKDSKKDKDAAKDKDTKDSKKDKDQDKNKDQEKNKDQGDKKDKSDKDKDKE